MSNWKPGVALFGASLLATFGAGTARAQCLGATPVFAPGTIAADGTYCVTQNIIHNGPGPALEIAACDVHLELQGFTVANLPPNGAPVILVTGGCVRLSIRNGAIAGGSHGVHVPAGVLVPDLTLEDLRIHDIVGGSGIQLSDGWRGSIRRNHFAAIDGAAIAWDNLGIPKTGMIADNVIREAGRGIEVFNAQSLAILNNRITNVLAEGIHVTESSGVHVLDNTVERAGADGITLGNCRGLRVSGNTVVRSGFHGMSLDCANCLIAGNDVSESGQAGAGHGLWIRGARNRIERNLLNDNLGYGLLFLSMPAGLACDNTYGGNAARGNAGAGGPACVGAPTLFPPDSCNANGCPAASPNTSYGDNLIPGPPPF